MLRSAWCAALRTHGCATQERRTQACLLRLLTQNTSLISSRWMMESDTMEITPTTPSSSGGWDAFKLHKTIINTITTNPDDACYVTGVCANATHIATSSSNNVIKLYNTSDFTLEGELTGHTTTINKILFKKKRPHELVSCSMDKKICIWDTNKKAIINCLSSPKEVLTVAINEDETILASACDTDIYIWNLQNNSLTRIIRDQHSMEITWVSLMKKSDKRNINIKIAFNFEQSILNFLFFGPSNALLSSISQVGTFAIWDLLNEELFHDFGNLREILTKDAIAVDYLIKCFYSTTTNKLLLVAGSYSGDLMIYSVEGKELVLLQHMTNAHSDIVRDVLWFEQAKILLTVGEDSRLCVWRTSPLVVGSGAAESVSGPSQMVSPPEKGSRKGKNKKNNKAAPY